MVEKIVDGTVLKIVAINNHLPFLSPEQIMVNLNEIQLLTVKVNYISGRTQKYADTFRIIKQFCGEIPGAMILTISYRARDNRRSKVIFEELLYLSIPEANSDYLRLTNMIQDENLMRSRNDE